MTTKPSDLIAIANSDLAQKLSQEAAEQANTTEDAPSTEAAHTTFRQDIWKAVYTLNLFRYLAALVLLVLAILPYLKTGWTPIRSLIHPDLFIMAVAMLLISAVCFTYITTTRKLPLSTTLIVQFFMDIVIAASLTHATGSITSSFVLLFFIVVTTGSVVSKRKHAVALASGSIILLFYEHFYSILTQGSQIEARYDLLAGYGLLLIFSGWLVSYLAQRVKAAELKSFVPGNETIDDFLIREEINALRSALQTTQGNKTEAAKLLGMTFRSFRYKLTKYDID